MIRNNAKPPNAGLTRSNSRKSSDGFTIIELMIATTVFSVILLLCATALVQIGRVYYKGVLSGKTQNTTRSIMDEIASSIEYSGSNVQQSGNVLCVGNLRYTVNPNHMLIGDGVDYALIAERVTSCSPSTGYGGGGCTPPDCRELLSPRMRLSIFNITPTAGSNLYGIDINVISGEDDLINPTDPNLCGVSINAGGQFCAASRLTTYVQKRL